jgi:RHS repeat-associated protein
VLAEINPNTSNKSIGFSIASSANGGLRVTNRANNEVQEFITSDGNAVGGAVEFPAQHLQQGGISFKQADVTKGVRITSMRMINVPNVVYVNYIAPNGEVIGSKRYDDNGREHFYIKDYLGNVRATVRDDGTMVSAQDFDPYGDELRGFVSGGATQEQNKHKYLGAELNYEIDLYLLGPRLYDPKLGMFRSVDPLYYKMPSWSSYHYAFSNPMRFIDPSGMEGEETDDKKKEEKKKDEKKAETNEANAGTIAPPLPIPIPFLDAATVAKFLRGLSLVLMPLTMPGDNPHLQKSEASNEQANDSNSEPASKSEESSRHEGFKKQTEKYDEKNLKRAEKSFEKRIKKHEDKINKDPNSKHVEHWKKEIKNFKEQLDIVKKEMRKRGL